MKNSAHPTSPKIDAPSGGDRKSLTARLGLRLEIIFNLTALVLVTVGLIGLLFLKLSENAILEQERYRDRQIVLNFQQLLDELFAGQQVPLLGTTPPPPGAVQQLLSRIGETHDLAEAFIIDSNHSLVAYYQKEANPFVSTTDDEKIDAALGSEATIQETGWADFFFDTQKGHFVYYASVHIGSNRRGVLKAVFGLSQIRAVIKRARLQLALFLLLWSGILIVFIALLINRIVLQPIKLLRKQTERISLGEFPPPLILPADNELSVLSESFNRMSASLRDKEIRLTEQLYQLTHLNRALVDRQRELAQSEKMAGVGRLSAALAHEIGNPLGALIGYAQILEKRIDNPDALDILKRMQKEMDRVDGLISGLLEYARPTGAELQLVPLHQVIQHSILLLRDQKQLRTTEIELALDANPDRIRADRQGLQQIIVNIALNALHAMEGEGTLRLGTRAIKGIDMEMSPYWQPPLRNLDPDNLFLRLEISDTGPGISEDGLGKLFEPFFTTKEVGEGTGLGLAVVARLVMSYHGHIRGANRSEGGASFVMVFPFEDPTPIRTEV